MGIGTRGDCEKLYDGKQLRILKSINWNDRYKVDIW